MVRSMGLLLLGVMICGCRESAPLPVFEGPWEPPCDAHAPPLDASVAARPDAAPEPADAGTSGADMRDAGPPPRCIGNYAEGVAVFAAETFLVLQAHTDPPETREITAWPWQTSLGAVRPVALSVEWRIDGDTALFETAPLPDPRVRRLRIAATGDVFDMDGHEPYVTVRACVTNRCPETAGDGRPCRCEPEVCSPVTLVAAVPQLAGRWDFVADGVELGTFDLEQSGRTLRGAPFDFDLDIEGVGVRGGDLGTAVIGAIASDRMSMTGLRLTEDGDVLGPWSARRVN